MAPVLFNLQDVRYRYEHEVAALDGLSFQIQQGQRIALLGANGSGKSTLLRILDGLCFAESGIVHFEGEPLDEKRLQDLEFQFAFRRRVGLVFQNSDVQLFNPTVFDEIAFGPLQLRWPKDVVLRRVSEVLELMRITELKGRPPHRLSGGEKKRVALASVLVLEPEVLLMDEPTSGLDPRSQSQLIDLLSANGQARTVVTATQDLHMVEEIADHCHVLQAGRIVASGTPQEILADTLLLERTNLIHAHRHTHSGLVHSHAHRHNHTHNQE